jgi:hypothetical protein
MVPLTDPFVAEGLPRADEDLIDQEVRAVHVDPDLLQLYRKTLTRSQSYDF